MKHHLFLTDVYDCQDGWWQDVYLGYRRDVVGFMKYFSGEVSR